MTRWAKSWRVVGIVGTLAGVAAVSGTAPAGAAEEPQHKKAAPVCEGHQAADPQAYGLVYAVRSGTGYTVFGANGEPFPWCGSYARGSDPNGLGPHCHVASIDFGPMGLQPDGVKTVL